MELFKQNGPELTNQFEYDALLTHYLQAQLGADLYQEVAPTLSEMGEISAGELYQHQLADRLNEPTLTHWNPWGERIDQIEITSLWKRCEQLSAEYGLIATPYEQKYGVASRTVQFALAYLFTPSNDIYSCPLAMTDGATRTLLNSDNKSLIDRAVPHLTSRDPKQFWTSGQWMTELTGGSDVGRTETIAKETNGQWGLHGRKWFTSATTSQMTLTLARPEGNPEGGKGLALYYVELRDKAGRLQNIEVCRLKDKLGTRKVPTAELLLHGTPAQLVMGTANGVKNISPMLNITRTWNSVSAISLMRRGLALAQNYAQKRFAFGAYLKDKPLHRQTLAQLEAQLSGAFHLTFKTIELLGQSEIDGGDMVLLRFMTPITKLTTGKQAVASLSETLECFGGAGYVEDTGLPMLLRDAQVLPIWEGTTNVLSLDTLRSLARPEEAQHIYQTLMSWGDGLSIPVVQPALRAIQTSFQWLQNTPDRDHLEAGARCFALNIGRALEIILWARSLEKQSPEAQAHQTPLLNHLAFYQPFYTLSELPL